MINCKVDISVAVHPHNFRAKRGEVTRHGEEMTADDSVSIINCLSSCNAPEYLLMKRISRNATVIKLFLD
jgi:hypothetical protein